MLTQIFVFATHDLDVMPEFPHEFSAWADGGPVDYFRGDADLTRQKFTGVEQTRTVTTEGLQSPVHGFLRVAPPKYPPCQLTGYNCDHSIISDVEAHAQIIVYAVNTIDPDDYDSLPVAMQDMKPDDPIKEDVWVVLEAGLIAVTPAGDQRDQVTAALGNWRTANPLGTAREFAVSLRNFTS